MTNAVQLAQYGSVQNSFKNRIINGGMVIDQRNAGASISVTDGAFIVDRWKGSSYDGSTSVTGKYTAQQNAGAVTPPAGFINYLGITSSAATSFAAGAEYVLSQNIEGLNITDFGWGSANASTVTLSFWVRSSLTGSFGGSVLNSTVNRSYPFGYTISAANTWEQKTITIAGDTSGTWLTTNSIGIRLYFSLGVGSSFKGTANTWSANRYEAPTGSVDVLGTNGATFYITGVQLEKGSTATSFDYRPYGTELQLCQRYFEMSYPLGTAPGNPGSAIQSTSIYGVKTTTYILQYLSYKVPKRATPTLVIYDNAGNINKTTRDDIAIGSSDNQNASSQSGTANGIQVYSSGTFNAAGIVFNYTASAEL